MYITMESSYRIWSKLRPWTYKARPLCKKVSSVAAMLHTKAHRCVSVLACRKWQTTNVTRWAARTGIFISLRKCATHWQQFSWTRLRLLFGRQLFDFRTHLMNSFLLRQKPFNVQHLIYRWTENYFQRLLSNEINCLREHFELKDYGSHRIEESVLQSNLHNGAEKRTGHQSSYNID